MSRILISNLPYFQGYGLTPSTPSFRSSAPSVYHEYARNGQASWLGKRRREEGDVAYSAQQSTHEKERTQLLEPARKVCITQSMRQRENAKYGLIPVAGRRAVRWTEESVRATARAAYAALMSLGTMYDDIKRNAAEKDRPREQYGATVESVNEGGKQYDLKMLDEQGSESTIQDTDSDGISDGDDSTDTESALDDSLHDHFQPSPKPPSTVLPLYLVPARVPPHTPPSQRRSDSVLATRRKSTRAQTQVTGSVAPMQPERPSTRPSRSLATPRTCGIPSPSRSVQGPRPATAATSRLSQLPRSLLKPTAGTSRPVQPPPPRLPAPIRPSNSASTSSLPIPSPKPQNPAQTPSQPQKASQLPTQPPAPPKPNDNNNSIQCSQCMLYNPLISTSCRACGPSSLPPRPAPRSHATGIAPIDKRPDVLYDIVLVSYTDNSSSHQQSSKNSEVDTEFLCTGGAGPAGTIDEKTSEMVPISETEWTRLLKEKKKKKKKKEMEDLKRAGRWERANRMRGGGGGGGWGG